MPRRRRRRHCRTSYAVSTGSTSVDNNTTSILPQYELCMNVQMTNSLNLLISEYSPLLPLLLLLLRKLDYSVAAVKEQQRNRSSPSTNGLRVRQKTRWLGEASAHSLAALMFAFVGIIVVIVVVVSVSHA